jgi:hypothetical protein
MHGQEIRVVFRVDLAVAGKLFRQMRALGTFYPFGKIFESQRMETLKESPEWSPR